MAHESTIPAVVIGRFRFDEEHKHHHIAVDAELQNEVFVVWSWFGV